MQPPPPPTAYLVLDVLPVLPRDAFERVLVAARAAGLVGAMLDQPDSRATETALVALAFGPDGRPLRAVDGKLRPVEPDELVEDIRRRAGAAVRLTHGDGTLIAESILPAAAERWEPPAPRRWAWSIAPTWGRPTEMRATADALAVRLVEVTSDDRRLVVGSTDAMVAWQPQDRPVIGLSVDATSAIVSVHADASRMGRRRPRGIAAAAMPDLTLGWGFAPVRLVSDPSDAVAAAQDVVARALAPSVDAEAEAQLRQTMAALGRAAHADALLALALEDLGDDTVDRVLLALGVPDALRLLATGEVDAERLPDAVVHEPSRWRAWGMIAALAGWLLLIGAAGGWGGGRIADALGAPWPAGSAIGAAVSVGCSVLAMRAARVL